MFNDLPVSGTNPRCPTRTRWTLLISAVVELTVLGLLLILPLIQTQALPFHWLETPLVPPAAAPAAPRVHVTTTPVVVRSKPAFTLPTNIPAHALVIRESAAPPSQVAPSIKDGIPGSVGTSPDGLFTSSNNPAPPAPVAPPPTRIVQTSSMQEARLINFVRPEYPAFARQARIEGTVVLEAIIGTDGTVKALHYVSGPPLLVQAALNAVGQWRYRPMYLNGRPVEVQTTITVHFNLQN